MGSKVMQGSARVNSTFDYKHFLGRNWIVEWMKIIIIVIIIIIIIIIIRIIIIFISILHYLNARM